MQTVAVLGSGAVGEALANGFLKHGYAVSRGSRDPSKLRPWHERVDSTHATIGSFREAALAADLIVLAVKGDVAHVVLDQCGHDALAGKVVIDTTNPLAEGPPVHGVLRFFTAHDESLMERMQERVPAARFVKAFSCVGAGQMVDPDYGRTKPSMFICGNDDAAKREVTTILEDFGWDVEDMGRVEAARAIEPLCMLWCIPGFREGSWSHAFKLLRK